jgi:hypothetical protein
MNMAFKPILAAQWRTFITLVFFALISVTHAQTVWDGTTNTAWNVGDGPYTISTAEELAGLASLVNGGNNFAGKTINLAADIVLNNTTGWESWGTSAPAHTWTRIGTNTTAQQFQGIFNGNGHVVSGIYISNTTSYQGLFGYVGTNGIIKNLGITQSYVKGGDATGGMVGRNNGQVSNSYSIGTIAYTASSSNDVGGLVGNNGSGTVNNCYSTGQVTGGGTSYGGGLVGGSSSGTINNGYYDKTTSGKTDSKGEGKVTADMQNQAFVDALNFSAGLLAMNGWQFNSGDYPTLTQTPASNPLDGKFGNNNAGTELNPYLISSVTHLKNLSSLASVTDFKGYFFKLGQNIAFVGGDNPFTAIGSNTKPFNGTFDGDNKTISNVSISGTTYQGLFGYIGASGTLKNLGVTGSTVNGVGYVGGLAGYLIAGAKINDSYFSGTVTGTGANVGGLAGFNAGAIRGSHSTGSVTGADDVGGLVGYTGAASTIGGSYSTSTVTGDNEVGGLVGNNVSSAKIDTSYSTGAVNGEENDLGGLVGVNGGIISNSYSTSTVTTEDGFYVGGLAGTNNGTINNSYSTGAVTGDMTVGGLVGRNSGTAVIYSSYSIGKVTGSDYFGGLAGTNASTAKINNSYYNNTVNSGLNDPRGEGKSTADMKAAPFVKELNSIAALISMKKWVISGGVNNGYPTISNEAAVEDLDFFFAGGDGTEATPYLITTSTHLKNISLLIDFGKSFTGKFLKLENNIDLSAISNWTPIGTYNGGSSPISKPFLGTFDGNGKTISNVKIDITSGNAQGLFGFLGENGTIKNLGATGSIKGTGADVGGLVGYTIAKSKISDSYFSGSVTGTGNFTGGFVGFNGGAISGCYSTGTVDGKQYTGGFAGGNQPGTITESYSTSTVTGTISVGGFVGRTSNGGWIDKSYSTGTVTGTDSLIGGFVGENGYPIKNSYSTGAVNGKQSVGGFVGKNTSATISNSYSTGAVTGTGNNVGGFVGNNNGTNTQINSSYSIGLVTGEAATNIGGFVGNYTSCTSCAINSGYYDKTVNSTLADPRNEGKISTDMKIPDFVDELNIIAGLLNMNEWVINSGANNGYPTLSTEVAPANITPFFAGGDGTETTPYLITTPTHLKNVSWLVDFGINFQGKFLKLTKDIALNNTENWETWDINPPTNSWSRIGTSDAKAFQGTFDGNGKVISGLYVTSASDGVGLFGNIGANGIVKNLGIIDSYIIGTGSYFYYAGGLTGNNRGIISNCYSKANVKTTQYGGGIAGDNYGTISNSYSIGKVNGTNNLGGLVGRNNYSTSYGTGRIENSYSTVLVTGTSTALGGLVGNFVTNSVIANSYYDKTVNNTLTDPRSEGKTTEELKLQATFAGWDFATIWSISNTINNGYPDLKWSACSIGGGAWENGTCKMPGVFPSPSLVFNTTYTSTLTLGDLPLNEHNGYAWSEPTDTRLFAGNNQSFAVTYTDPSGNYTIAYGDIVVNVEKATGQTNEAPPHITISASNTNPDPYSLSTIALEKRDHGPLSYALGTFTDGTNILTAKPTISEDGHTLTYTSTGKASGTATLEVIVKSQNYTDLIVTLTFEANPKPEVTITGITAQNFVYDGEPKLGYEGTPAAIPYTGKFIYEYAGTGYPQSTTPPTNVGEYTLRVTLPDDAPYTGEWRGVFEIKAAEPPTFSNRENPKIGRIGVQTKGNYILLENLPKNAKVEVYNLQGKLIYSAHPENPQILRIGVQTKGMYIVKIANQTLRVVVR